MTSIVRNRQPHLWPQLSSSAAFVSWTLSSRQMAHLCSMPGAASSNGRDVTFQVTVLWCFLKSTLSCADVGILRHMRYPRTPVCRYETPRPCAANRHTTSSPTNMGAGQHSTWNGQKCGSQTSMGSWVWPRPLASGQGFYCDRRFPCYSSH